MIMWKKKEERECMAAEEGFLANPRDEWSFKTHALGFILSIIATIALIIHERLQSASLGSLITIGVFGASMIALYLCSSIYHYSTGGAEVIAGLRKLDHSMIYVLIAGTYTPIVYAIMDWPKSMIWLICTWCIAFVGIIIKMFWMDAPRWLYTSLYILMGWAIVFDFKAVLAMPTAVKFWLLIGGIFYTIGAVVYIIKKPNPSPKFGFHEIFHVFIILGTAGHFIAVMLLI